MLVFNFIRPYIMQDSKAMLLADSRGGVFPKSPTYILVNNMYWCEESFPKHFNLRCLNCACCPEDYVS